VTTFARTDRSAVARWWWTVDRWMLVLFAALTAAGVVLVMAASPPVAERLGLSSFHFVQRHLVFLVPAVLVTFGVSLLSPRDVRRLGSLLLLASLLLLVATLFFGPEVKGSRRWLSLGGFSLQPGEFVKPGLAVVTAWMLAEARQQPGFPGFAVALVLYLLVAVLLALQPDFGMTVVVSAVWLAQIFLSGQPLVWIVPLGAVAVFGAAGAYLLMPHVASRVERFLDPSSGDTYQIDTALGAFASGGVFGRGPGEGRIKAVLPDAHTDFVFAVAGEEFGLLVCVLIVLGFAAVVLRGFARALQSADLFAIVAAGGLLTQLGLQALINMGVNLNLLPTKGMTLPFISYGGSSMFALALSAGMVLALTRRRASTEVAP
jgi:cell division protein FtsW